MKEKEGISKLVKRLLSSRNKQQLVTSRQKAIFNITFNVLLFIAYVTWISAIYELKDRKWEMNVQFIYEILNGTGLFLGAVIFNLAKKSSPSTLTKNERNEWLWSEGRKRYILFFWAFTIIAIAQLLPADLSVYGQYKYFASLGFWGYSLFSGVVLIVIWKPKLFLSYQLTGFGSGAAVFALSQMPVRLASIFNPSPIIFFLIMSIATLFAVAIIISRSVYKYSLNPVQVSVLSFIKPERLLISLRTHYNEIRDQYNAVILHKKLVRELSPGIKTELIKIFAEQYKSEKETRWWIAGVFSIIVFVVGAIGEAFFQDLLYQPFVKKILCTWLPIICGA